MQLALDQLQRDEATQQAAQRQREEAMRVASGADEPQTCLEEEPLASSTVSPAGARVEPEPEPELEPEAQGAPPRTTSAESARLAASDLSAAMVRTRHF